MAGLVEQVAGISKRVEALETKDLANDKTISRITKMYGGVQVTLTITTSTHTYRTCSASLACSATLKI